MRQLFFYVLACMVLALAPATAENKGCTDCDAWQSGKGGRGTGRPECVVSFFAPKGATKFEIQLFDEKGAGILPDGKSGEIKPRGGVGVDRIGIGCDFVRRAAKLVACATIEGKDKTTVLYANRQNLPLALKERRLTVPF